MLEEPGCSYAGAASLHKRPDRQDEEHSTEAQIYQTSGERDAGMLRVCGRTGDELSDRPQYADQSYCCGAVHRMAPRGTAA
jgi:hypothetical protein